MNEPYAEQLNWDKYVLPKNMKKCCLYINFNTELTYLYRISTSPLCACDSDAVVRAPSRNHSTVSAISSNA